MDKIITLQVKNSGAVPGWYSFNPKFHLPCSVDLRDLGGVLSIFGRCTCLKQFMEIFESNDPNNRICTKYLLWIIPWKMTMAPAQPWLPMS